MNICVFSKSWASGAGWFGNELARSIAGAGADVIFVAPEMTPSTLDAKHPNLLRKKFPREIIDTAPKWLKILSSIRRVVFGSLLIIAQIPRAKVFICTLHEQLPVTIAVFMFLRLMRRKLIYVVHDPLPHAWSYPRNLRALERAMLYISYRLPNRLVTLTHSGKAVLSREFGIRESIISVIPHGIYPLSKAIAPIGSTQDFLVFGSLRRNKKLKEIIEAWRNIRTKNPDAKLIIAGAPHNEDREYWSECQQLIAENPDGFEVHARFIDDGEIPELFERVGALILAYEEFDSQSGVAVLAAVNGRPVIATSSGGLAELFNQGMAGVKIEGPVTSASIESAVNRFAEQGLDHWQTASAKGQAQLIERLGWQGIGVAYVTEANSMTAA